MGETVTDKISTETVIEELTDYYNLIEYNAESDFEFSLTQIETMRNIGVNRLARGKFTLKPVGRESAMFSSPHDSSSRSTA